MPISGGEEDSTLSRDIMEVLKRHADQLANWQRSSFLKIPLLIKLPYSYLENQSLMLELAKTCDRLGVERRMIKLGAIRKGPNCSKLIDALQPIRLLGFQLISEYSIDMIGNLSDLLLGSDELEVDFSSVRSTTSNGGLRVQLADFLSQARRIGIAVSARGVRTSSDYEWLCTADGFVSAQGSFFWEAMPAENLLRMELTFDKFFARGWRVVEGRFIPNNPLYFRPFPL